MATLPSSGPLSINDIKNVMGGPASPSMANYYRGGAYVPSTKTTTTNVREPTSGAYYQLGSGGSVVAYYWLITINGGAGPYETNGGNRYMWNRYPNQGTIYIGSGNISTYTSGIYTYYRGDLRYSYYDSYYGITDNYRDIYRTYQDTVTVNINTSVPTSGQISISQFYGAEKP